MDAKKMLALLGGVLVALAGCVPLRDSPTARPEEPNPAEPLPPSEVVQAAPASEDADGTAEEVDTLVQGYIANVDGIAMRLQQPEHRNPGRLVTAVEQSPLPPDAESGWPKSVADPMADPGEAGGASPQDRQPPVEQVGGSTTAPAAKPEDAGPPVLSELTVQGTPSIPPAEPRDVSVTAVNTPAVAQNAPVSLRDVLAHWPGDPEASSFRRQLDRRMIAVLAGDYAEARRPLTMVSEAQQDIAARFVESLIVIRDEHDGDPAGASTRIMEELARLTESLRSLSDLRIPTLAICSEVSGYGNYKPIEPAAFPAGVASEFVTYCEVTDFVRERGEDGLYISRFDMRTRVLDSLGETILDVRDRDIVDRCRQPRHDCFIPRLIRLPATLPAGEYVVKVTIVDKLGEKVTENRASFRVLASP